MRPHFTLNSCWISLFLAVLTLSPARATLLVYEGFNGYSTLSGVAPNSNTIGLNKTVNYAGASVGSFAVSGSSIAFGSNFLTTGGSISAAPTGAVVAAATLSLSPSPYTGTLYSSYLVQLNTKSAVSGDGALARVSNDAANLGEHFLAMADNRAGTSTNTGVGYDSTVVSGSTGLNTGPYLMLSIFTRVGLATSVGSPGVGTVYALTLTQYESFLSGGATESYLNTAGIGTGANQVSSRVSDTITSGTFNFQSGQFAQFLTVGDSAQFDEMRYGTTLADVTPIPEPSSVVLLAAGLGMLYALRRR